METKLFENCLLIEAGNVSKIKNYSDTYLYSQSNNEKALFNFLMSAHYIDKTSESFRENIRIDLKRRRVNNAILNTLDSSNVILCISADKPLYKAYKVITAKDIRGDRSKLKVFVDVTGIIDVKDGIYTFNNVNSITVLTGYLIAALNSKMYFSNTGSVLNHNALLEYGSICFSNMVNYVIDYLRIAGGASKAKEKIKYFSSMYFQINIMMKDISSESVHGRARKIAGISEQEESMFNMYLSSSSNPYLNINTFITALAEVIHCSTLTLQTFIEKWMFLFGAGTQYGTELYPDFSRILIDTYVGSYVNNQDTIEKVVGGLNISKYVEEIYKIGSDL